MLDVIIWTAIIGSALCVLVFLTLAVLILASGVDMWRKKRALRHPIPPPDRAAERMYGQQYFDRAIGKKVD